MRPASLAVPPITMRVLAALGLFVGFAFAFIACDTLEEQLTPDEITFGGVTYSTIGQARFRLEEDALVVTNIGTSGNDGAQVSQTGGITEADFRVRPVSIPAGGRWGMEVFSGSGSSRTSLATVWNEAIDGQRHRIEVDFAASLGVETVTISYLLFGDLALRVPGVLLNGGSDERIRRAAAGETDSEPESVHVVRDGPKIVVSTDYGGQGGGARTSGETQQGGAGGCPTGAALVFLNFPGIPDLPSSVCTDYVEVSPDIETAMPEATSVEIRARTLSEFAFIDGSLD